MEEKKQEGNGLDRRDFMKCSAVLGGSLLASQMGWVTDLMKRAEAGQLTPEEEYELIRAENTLRYISVQYGLQDQIDFSERYAAVALKIDGNPYNLL
jgi:hypothetical protein